MPWTDQPGPRPQRSEEQLLDGVRRRAGAIRRARRARLSVGMGCVGALLLVAIALARTGDDPPSQLQVVGPDSPTSTAVVATTVVPEPSTTTISPAQTTTTRVGTTIPRTTVRTTPPTTRPAPATTVRPTTTTVRDVRVTCDASEVVITATPERSTYPVGSKVMVTAAALNRGSRECFPYSPSMDFYNAAGASVGVATVTDAFTLGFDGEPPPTWSAGETLTLPFEWPQMCGSGIYCPAGQYTVVVTFGPFRSSPAPFTIT